MKYENPRLRLKKCLYVLIISVGFGCDMTSRKNSVTSSETDGLPTTQHRIFISSATYSGNLGGLTGADSKCQTLASAAGLTRTYKAIISSSTVDAKDRITITGKVWNFTSATTKNQVVADSAEMWNRQLGNDLDPYDEAYVNRGAVPDTQSHTLNDGTKATSTSSDVCNDWTTTAGGLLTLGAPFAGNTWLNNDNGYDCATLRRILCISQ